MADEDSSFPPPITVRSKRFPLLVGALDTALAAAVGVFDEMEPAAPGVDLILKRIFERAFDTLEGATLLLANDHWELAAAHARTLFELNLDAEEIAHAGDREAAASRYGRFGLLQVALDKIARLRSAIALETSDETNFLRNAEEMLLDHFPEFLDPPNRRGERRWQQSWCGRSIKQRAARSPVDARMHQYDTIYRTLSAHAHASPMAVYGLRAQYGLFNPEGYDPSEWHRYENSQVLELTAILMNLFGDLWVTGLDYLPPIPRAFEAAYHLVMAHMNKPSVEDAGLDP